MSNDVLRSGWWRAQVDSVYEQRARGVARRKSPLIGVSEFAWLDEPDIDVSDGADPDSDLDAGAIDLGRAIRLAMPLEHDAAGSEGVADQAVRARLDVPPLDRQDPIRVVEIPRLATPTGLEAGELELGAHRAVR